MPLGDQPHGVRLFCHTDIFGCIGYASKDKEVGMKSDKKRLAEVQGIPGIPLIDLRG